MTVHQAIFKAEADFSASPLREVRLNPFLKKQLEPLYLHYRKSDVTEIRVMREAEVVVIRRGKPKEIRNDPKITPTAMRLLIHALANYNSLPFHALNAPKLSCVLPGGHRFEAASGASVHQEMSIAIRCKHPFTATWADFGCQPEHIHHLKQAMYESRNIVISGTTNTGKTTLLNLLLSLLDPSARVVAMEDTSEIDMAQFFDGRSLLAARDSSGAQGLLDWRQLYDHSMRITPDHIIFSEISTENAFAATQALSSGITGFMCTIHASSPIVALEEKFRQNLIMAKVQFPGVADFLRANIDLVIQIKRAPDGRRHITDLYAPKTDTWLLEDEGSFNTRKYEASNDHVANTQQNKGDFG